MSERTDSRQLRIGLSWAAIAAGCAAFALGAWALLWIEGGGAAVPVAAMVLGVVGVVLGNQGRHRKQAVK